MSESEKKQEPEGSPEAENLQKTGNPPEEAIQQKNGVETEVASASTPPVGSADVQKDMVGTPENSCEGEQKGAAEEKEGQGSNESDAPTSSGEPAPFYREIMVDMAPSVDAKLVEWMKGYSFDPECVTKVHSPKGKVLVLSPEDVQGRDWWFIGDIHGDIRALKCIVGKIRSESEDSRIVFLGDIFDRNLEDGGFETVKCFLSMLRDGNGEIIWLAGNHDTSLQYDEAAKKFPIATNRSEFASFLNEHPDLHEFGKELVRIIGTLPEALVFPDGLIASHGGVPHVDVSEKIKSLVDFETVECSNDFTWGRMTEAKFKFPDRTSRGHELGRRDFEKFCEHSANIFTAVGCQPVSGIVFGHQHLLTNAIGYKKFESYPGNPPSVCLYSSFMLEPVMAWGTNALYATPCSYHRRSDGTYEVCGFVPKEGGRLDADLREEAQKRIDADDE